MSTIKSSTEHLTLNADGSGKDLKLQTNGTERVIVKSTGDVGIGTSSPSNSLHIKGDLRIEDGTDTTTRDYIFKTETNGEFTITDSVGSQEKLRILPAGGITFNGDTAAANALDDYEEGTWTPNWASLTLGNGTSTGKYVKVGRLVHVTAYFQMGSTSVMGSKLESTNLPFPCPNLTYSGCRYENYQQSSYTGATRTNGNLLRGYTIKTGSAQALEQPANTVNPFTWGTNDYAELTITYYTY